MPFRYIIHKEQRLVLSIGRGRVTFDEITEHRKRLLRDPGFNPIFNQLNDFTAATQTDISGTQVSWFASRSVFSPSSRRAMVVTNPALFGIARQFEVYHGERATVHVFRDWSSALKWLGLHDISCSLMTDEEALLRRGLTIVYPGTKLKAGSG
jgi:hypothetical protein